MKTTALLACLLCLGAFAGESETLFEALAEKAYQEGIAKLKDSQADHAALLPAMRLLAKAAEAFEKAGDEAKVVEVNSCLYFAKKKMTLADTQGIGTNGTAKRLEVAAKPIPASEAKAMLEKAEAFAAKAEPLLAAIRLFEVADRFPETPEGRKAMGLSLAAMGKAGTEKAIKTTGIGIPLKLASGMFFDNIGSSVGVLHEDMSSHNNRNYHMRNVPKELDRKACTLLCSGKVGPMTFRFTNEGVLCVLLHDQHPRYQMVVDQLKESGAERNEAWHPANEFEKFEVWQVPGTTGKIVVISSYVIFVAEKIERAHSSFKP
ncbi:MAG: hypothetical protein NTW87_24585 [Planctomycetota bacterium]|nr:hypothetical protein [Planctomycetota bacterium]